MRTWTDVFFAAVRRGDDPFRAMDVADAWRERQTPRDLAWRLSRGVIPDVETTEGSIPQMNFSEMDEVYARYPKLPREHRYTAVAEVILSIEEAAVDAVYRALYSVGYGDRALARKFFDEALERQKAA